jgi:hypothetical protein
MRLATQTVAEAASARKQQHNVATVNATALLAHRVNVLHRVTTTNNNTPNNNNNTTTTTAQEAGRPTNFAQAT